MARLVLRPIGACALSLPANPGTLWPTTDAVACRTIPNRLERLIYLYTKTYLQDDILVKVDRASMACSLEVRAPFLDVDLVEFLGRVPPNLKLRRLDTKHLLKRAMSDLLPPGIASRRKKGFGIPIAEWFKVRASRGASGGARRGAADGARHLRAARGAVAA